MLTIGDPKSILGCEKPNLSGRIADLIMHYLMSIVQHGVPNTIWILYWRFEIFDWL